MVQVDRGLVTGDEQCRTIRRRAIFDPVGLSGLRYWYGVYPLHQGVFAGMLRNLMRAARSAPTTREVPER